MENRVFTVESNEQITQAVFRMRLSGHVGTVVPGQFVNVALEGFFLRRPISVCDACKNSLTLVYKAVGRGTDEMSRLLPGARLDLLTGLGNGYDLGKCGDFPLLIGGGAGVPPLYFLAKKLIGKGKRPKIILGFNTASEIFYDKEFRALGMDVFISTADGTSGIKGFVTDALDECGFYDYIYACGPEPMLKAVCIKSSADGQYSFEERMGCGFGACMGCSCKTKYGSKRICRDGPVLEKEEIIW